MKDVKIVVSIFQTSSAYYDDVADSKTLHKSSLFSLQELRDHMAHVRYQKTTDKGPYECGVVIRTKGLDGMETSAKNYFHLRLEDVVLNNGLPISTIEKNRLINAIVKEQLGNEAKKINLAKLTPEEYRPDAYPVCNSTKNPFDPNKLKYTTRMAGLMLEAARDILEDFDEEERISFNIQDYEFIKENSYYIAPLPRATDFYIDPKENSDVQEVLKKLTVLYGEFEEFVIMVKNHNKYLKLHSDLVEPMDIDHAESVLDYVGDLVMELDKEIDGYIAAQKIEIENNKPNVDAYDMAM
jgi:hypothetical protein